MPVSRLAELFPRDARRAARSFPPRLTNHVNYEAMKSFQIYVDQALKRLKDVCACCGLFISAGSKNKVIRSDLLFEKGIKEHIFAEESLDPCGKIKGVFVFCNTCLHSIEASKVGAYK